MSEGPEGGGPRARRSMAGLVGASAMLACGSDSGATRTGEAGVPATDASDAAGECRRHADCVEAHGEHWICRQPEQTCVNLRSDACDFVRGDSAEDDAVFVGLLSPEPGAGQFFGAGELVRSEFTEAVGGFPLAEADEPSPFVLVGCAFPFEGDPLPAARHLVEEVGVSALLGPAASNDVVNVAQNVTIPNGAVLMAPNAQSDVITDLADTDLVFRTIPTTSAAGPQFAAMLSDLEPVVREERKVDAIKVAVVSARDTYGISLSSSTLNALRFNGGLSGAENEQRGQLLAVSYDRTVEGFEREVAERVVAFEPDVVIMLSAFYLEPFESIERAWPTDEASAPYYLMDAGGSSFVHTQFVAGQPDALRRRIRVAELLDPTRPLYQDYLGKVERQFGGSELFRGAAHIYDAAYVVAYGIVASGERAPGGADIARGIRRLVGGKTSVDAVPAHIARGVSLLNSGEDIDLEGVAGPLEFDEHGDVLSDGAVTCLVRDAKGTVSPAFSGQIYRVGTGELEGRYECE